ncbi:MAG TPA: CRISPR-associated endonuclease Cas2, partial [Candidatus Yonathbacteria bacterium]|nr:CRISPR-associated endonuclease Cas2 [Candidatus Yonathbacteria bacterium]
EYSKGELAKLILLGIAGVGLIIVCVTLPGLGQVYELFKPKNTRDRKRLYRSTRQLEKQKLLRIYRKNGKDIVEVTRLGQRKILAYNLEDMKIKRPKKWDGWYRVIMFDIPEKKKIARREISSLLSNIGAYRIQKSTFVSPFECKKEIDFLGEYFDVRKNIVYMLSKNFDGEDAVKKHFKLS